MQDTYIDRIAERGEKSLYFIATSMWRDPKNNQPGASEEGRIYYCLEGITYEYSSIKQVNVRSPLLLLFSKSDQQLKKENKTSRVNSEITKKACECRKKTQEDCKKKQEKHTHRHVFISHRLNRRTS